MRVFETLKKTVEIWRQVDIETTEHKDWLKENQKIVDFCVSIKHEHNKSQNKQKINDYLTNVEESII